MTKNVKVYHFYLIRLTCLIGFFLSSLSNTLWWCTESKFKKWCHSPVYRPDYIFFWLPTFLNIFFNFILFCSLLLFHSVLFSTILFIKDCSTIWGNDTNSSIWFSTQGWMVSQQTCQSGQNAASQWFMMLRDHKHPDLSFLSRQTMEIFSTSIKHVHYSLLVSLPSPTATTLQTHKDLG